MMDDKDKGKDRDKGIDIPQSNVFGGGLTPEEVKYNDMSEQELKDQLSKDPKIFDYLHKAKITKDLIVVAVTSGVPLYKISKDEDLVHLLDIEICKMALKCQDHNAHDVPVEMANKLLFDIVVETRYGKAPIMSNKDHTSPRVSI